MTKIPKEIEDLSTDLQDMMETAEAVQGKDFANLVSYVMNVHNLTAMISMAVDCSIEESKNILRDDDDQTADIILRLLSSNTNSYAEALNLPEEKVEEAVLFINVIHEKINSTKNQLRNKK
jgi:hypothetical protein